MGRMQYYHYIASFSSKESMYVTLLDISITCNNTCSKAEKPARDVSTRST